LSKVEDILNEILNALTRTEKSVISLPYRRKTRIDNINYPKNTKKVVFAETCLLEKLIILKPGDYDSIKLYDGDTLFFDSVITPDTPKVMELNAKCHTNLTVYKDCPDALRHFKCDDLNPNVILDSSVNATNATGNNMTATNQVLGRVKGGVDFNGTDERIDAGNICNWVVKQPFSIALWFRPMELDGTRPLFRKTIFDAYLNNNAGKCIITFRIFDAIGGTMLIKAYDTFEGIRWDNQKWHQFAITYDGKGKTNGYRLYVNGKPAMLDIAEDNLSGAFKTSATSIYFGNLAANYFKGQMDDIRIYESELTPEQVFWLWNYDPRIAFGRGQPDEFKATEFLLIYKALNPNT